MPIDFNDPYLDFSTAEAELLRQQEAIKALRGFKPIDNVLQPQSFRSAVTGAEMLAPAVKKPLLSALSPLIADTTAWREDKDILGQRALMNAEQTRRFKSLTDRLKDKPGTPATPDTLGAYGVNIPGTPEGPPVPVTPEERAQIGGEMLKLPMYAKTGQELMTDSLVKEQERRHAFKLESQKERNASIEKERDRMNTLDAAYIRAYGSSGGKYTPYFAANGDVAGSVDEKHNIVYPKGGEPYSLDGRKVEDVLRGSSGGGAAATPFVPAAYARNGVTPPGAAGGAPAAVQTSGAAAGTTGGTNPRVIPGPPATNNAAAPPAPKASGQTVNIAGVGEVPVEKIPGYTPIVSNKADPNLIKRNQDIVTNYENGHAGLKIVGKMREFLDKNPTATNVLQEPLSDAKQAYDFITSGGENKGKVDPQVAQLRAFRTLVGQLESHADRKMFGPIFTEQDVKNIKETVGNLGRAKTDEERKLILDQLEQQFKDKLGLGVTVTTENGTSSTSSPAAAPPPAPAKPATSFPKTNASKGGNKEYVAPPTTPQEGEQLMRDWKAAPADRKGSVEQLMLSRGVVLDGRPYIGGDPSKKESWGPRK